MQTQSLEVTPTMEAHTVTAYATVTAGRFSRRFALRLPLHDRSLDRRCTRWNHTKLIQAKLAAELIGAIASWRGIHCPMHAFMVDGERGSVTSEKTMDYLTRNGIGI